MKKIKLEDNLSFYLSVSNYVTKYRPDIVIFSGVIQYLRKPNKIINYFIKKKVKNFFFLKTPFFYDKEVIKVQNVPSYIYKSSYPIRILNESRFLKLFTDNNYKIIPNFFPNEKIEDILFKNFILELRNRKNNIIK